MNRVKHPRTICSPFDAPRLALIAILMAATFAAPLSTAAVTPSAQPAPAVTVPSVTVPLVSSGQPNFGANVYIFTPSTPQSTIQATVDAVASTQVSNQFGTQRYAFLFEPGTYGSSANPLIFQVGYYTTVAGLGLAPADVTINGAINVSNQCSGGSCTALVNFWRSLSNLTINVVTAAACTSSAEFWAVSQASPIRRVQINGNLFLFDYCSNPAFASGGFIADSQFSGGAIINGGQQQWITRNSNIDSWTNGVWNQVFSGVVGAPAQCFPMVAPCSGPYTTLATSPVTREEPYLYLDAHGNYHVFVPAAQRNTSGASWAAAATPGLSIPINRFYVAQPTDSAEKINLELLLGKDLILTPGIYNLDRAIIVPYPDTVVLGLGMPTLIPQNGNASMSVLSSRGVLISGIIFDAGPRNSPVLLEVGSFLSLLGGDGSASDPSAIQDVFFRIGGAAAGSATFSLVVNSNNVILDDIWGWRADHGNGVGWTVNTADTGLVVNGDNVTAYGLFIEHYQRYEVIWNGNGGTDIFLQNEMPYDAPSQAAWMEAPGVDGYAAFKVANHITRFSGYGLGSYSFFNQGINIYAANAFEVPSSLPAGSMNDLLTIFLNTSGSGGILNVINNTGGSSTIANPDTPVTVVSYP
jgi:hypothetical protein